MAPHPCGLPKRPASFLDHFCVVLNQFRLNWLLILEKNCNKIAQSCLEKGCIAREAGWIFYGGEFWWNTHRSVAAVRLPGRYWWMSSVQLRDPVLFTGPKRPEFLFPAGRSGPTSNVWFIRPTRVNNQNSIVISSAFLQGSDATKIINNHIQGSHSNLEWKFRNFQDLIYQTIST